VRHRAGFGYSQLSQRYVDESQAAFVVPPAILGDEKLVAEWLAQVTAAQSGAFYAETLAPTGGVPPYRFAVTSGTLPAGLALDSVSVIEPYEPAPGPVVQGQGVGQAVGSRLGHVGLADHEAHDMTPLVYHQRLPIEIEQRIERPISFRHHL
jgi:hypothetical protein